MPLDEAEMLKQVATLAETIEPAAPPIARIGIIIFVSRVRKILSLIKFCDDKSKFKKLLKSVTLSEEDTIDKLRFAVAGWLTHA